MSKKTERVLEPLLAGLTAVAHGVFRHLLNWEFLFVLIAIGGWIMYAVVRAWMDPQLLEAWGWRRDHFWASGIACAAVTILGGAAMIIYGLSSGKANYSSGIYPIFGVYLVWAYVQQFILQAMVARHFRHWMPAWLTVLTVAILFGLSHVPTYSLAEMAALGAAVYVPIYLKWKNLWLLGLSQGILGTLALYVVIGYTPSISARLVVV